MKIIIKKIKNYFLCCSGLLFVTFLLAAKTNFLRTDSNIKQLLFKDDKVKCALFTSQHDIIKTLIELMNAEQTSMKIAAYMLTHKDIAACAIRSKKERGVSIEIVSGYDGYTNSFSKLPLLEKNEIPIYVFGTNKPDDFNQELMHNKYIIFEKNIDNKSLIWTGSFNFTKNAQAKNKENVLILEDKHIIDQYKQDFETLKKHSKLQPNNRFKEKFGLNKKVKTFKRKSKSKKQPPLGSSEDFKRSMQIKVS